METAGSLLLQLNDVGLKYKTSSGDVEALQSINLNIHEHEFVCVLGPSGCGKSSLLSLISGLEKVTRGKILLEGTEINGIDPRCGVVFQRDNLFSWYSVQENINYGLRMKKYPKDEIKRKTAKMLTHMGLTEFANKKIFELSGGMRQRVNIGRTLINQPEILLMDEPFSALDALTREQMQDFLRSLWMESNNTIFFITHDIDEALGLGTRLVVMSERPGTILRDMKLHYTYDISEAGNSRKNLSNDYFELRRDIYELVCGIKRA